MAARPPFRLGRKEVFLPNFTLTLLRTPHLPPSFAQFIVPLNLNKFDLRDYLFNLYGVRVLAVRSYIQQQKVRQDKPGARRPVQRRWYRPRAIKKMLIEMERPFVWPEEPEDYDRWDKETFDAARKSREESDKRNPMRRESRKLPTEERQSIAEQAKALLEGQAKWEAANPKWEDIGEAVEVEQHVTLPKET